jgi:hypothetical protein
MGAKLEIENIYESYKDSKSMVMDKEGAQFP